MTARGLLPEQRLDLLDYSRAAVEDTRACVELASDYGPALVAALRALAALGELREAIERAPERRPEEAA